jgi:hypothetical protein
VFGGRRGVAPSQSTFRRMAFVALLLAFGRLLVSCSWPCFSGLLSAGFMGGFLACTRVGSLR